MTDREAAIFREAQTGSMTQLRELFDTITDNHLQGFLRDEAGRRVASLQRRLRTDLHLLFMMMDLVQSLPAPPPFGPYV
jgi:hypothetical protein